jgi:hypothetical protein
MNAHRERARAALSRLVAHMGGAPRAYIEPEALASGWRNVLARIATGRVKPAVIGEIEQLAVYDPGFPSTHFVLGLAYRALGRFAEARAQFAAQLLHPSGLHRQLAAQLLAEVGE